MKTNKSDFINYLQKFVAISAVGVSALRNQGEGSIDYVRDEISKINLVEILNISQSEYIQWLNNKTDYILENWPHSTKPWGAVRKALNLFMRDCLYNKYLCKKYKIKKIEKYFEIPLDSLIAKELRRKNKKLVKWPGLKHLSIGISNLYQLTAEEIAKENKINRIHLDIYYWINGRKNGSITS